MENQLAKSNKLKTITFLFIALAFNLKVVVAQEEIITINSNSEIFQSFNVVDSETGNIAFFLEESNLVKGFLYDKNYHSIGKIFAGNLSNKYKEFIGYQISGKTIILFMNTNNGRSYGVLIFDFKTETSIVKEIDFKLKGEGYIESLSINNSFFLISKPKNSNQFNIYTFNNDLSSNLHEVKFKKDDFLDRKDRPINLNYIIKNLLKVDNQNPNAIETTTANVKLYNNEKRVTITSDLYNEFTFLINIDLDTFNYSIDRIFHPDFDYSLISAKSNSYIYEDYLFQLISSTKQLNIQLTDLTTKAIIKNYSVNKDQPIDFKNSKIILEGGDFMKYRELDKTSQFLRKISQTRTGISVYKLGSNYQITIGGVTERANVGYIAAGAIVGGMVGGILVASFNSVTTSFNGYANSKSIRFTGLFDVGFNHLEGDLTENPFDIMKEFFKEKKGYNAKTFFKYGDDYIFGFYNKNINLFEVFKI